MNLHYYLQHYFSTIRYAASFHLTLGDLFISIVCWLSLVLIDDLQTSLYNWCWNHLIAPHQFSVVN